MPEYLAPGVYVEEVSFRSKSIEGVSTSVAGFIGPTRYGPTEGPPELLTSFADFSRIYGGIDDLNFVGKDSQINYMAHAVRAFFDNGGSKLYVTRVYQANGNANGHATALLGSPASAKLNARFAGIAGNMSIAFMPKTSANVLVSDGATPPRAVAVRSARPGDVVYIKHIGSSPPTVAEGLYDVTSTGTGIQFVGPVPGAGTSTVQVSNLDPAQYRVSIVTLTVRVRRAGQFEDEVVWEGLTAGPGTRNALLDIFTQEPKSRQRYLMIPFAIETTSPVTSGAQLVNILAGAVLPNVSLNLATDQELRAISPPQTRPRTIDLEQVYTLAGGSDGLLPSAETYTGDDSGTEKAGLFTFEDIDQISMVAAPGYSADYIDNPQRADQIVQLLLTHCQIRMRYRVAVLDAPNNQVLSEVQAFRGKFDSTHAALYYPWITTVDPLDPDGRREIELPPSGFVAGIYARTDVLHGVYKAPANEVVMGAIDFELLLNKAQQDILNPLGINCFRFFDGRGFRLWGARTISSDPEWKYISVRRYFAYLEHSIDRGTQWAVFENNSDSLWANIRQTIEDFLFTEWRNGALLGTKPEQAFFVRCDRSTMTQNDLDNGRLVCLIGVAPVKPAEFVIFRIGQFTANSRS
jgi:phage tail sheath protein FI